jgi:glycosyltransferase involved in cell wall biosynthesis
VSGTVKARVLHVLPDLAIGGGQTIVLQHARHADRDRYDVTVCHLRPEDAMAASFVEAGVVPVAVGVGPTALRSLVRLARGVDLVHVHSDFDRRYGHAAALAAGVPVVGHLHAEWVHLGPMYPPGHPGPLRRVRARVAGVARDALERRAVRHYIAESRDVQAVFAPLVRQPITVMNQAVALDRFTRPAAGVVEGLRRELAPGGGPVLLCVSRLVPGKGQERLVAMLPAVLERWPSATLVLVGDGSDRAALEARVAAFGLGSRVRFTGARFDVPDLLAATDVFVFASETEGFGLAVLEAMAARVPVVAFRLPALEEFTVDGTTAWLVDQDDERSFVERVDSLLLDPARARAMGEAGRAVVERDYAPDAVARSFESVYQQVLQPRAAARKEAMA